MQTLFIIEDHVVIKMYRRKQKLPFPHAEIIDVSTWQFFYPFFFEIYYFYFLILLDIFISLSITNVYVHHSGNVPSL